MDKKLSVKEFIKRAKVIHGDKYDYSKVNYINNSTKICIICPTHGEFWQSPKNHMNGHGCDACGGTKTMNSIKFIEKAVEVHGNIYDYSKVKYINNRTKVCIICLEHGEFWQIPKDHLKGCGCKKCKGLEKSTTEKFIKKAKEIHSDKYGYSKVNYINNHTKVCIICPTHGEFWQAPNYHLNGQGCPKCNSSKLEEEIRNYLQEKNIFFEEQKKFDWLGKQSLDFFIPKHNIAIECQGIQHFQSIEHFGGKNNLLQTKIRDERKRRLCKENNIHLLYYSNLGIEYPYKVFENKEKLLEEIKNYEI